MVNCDFCDEEFEEEKDLHLHWGEQHEDELNSHQKEKVKKAEREKQKEKEQKIAERKRMAGYGLAALAALAVVGFVITQVNLGGPSNTADSLDISDRPMLGSENASVTVVEFGDYSCGYCRDFHRNTQPQIKEDYIDSDDVKFVYMHYAFLGDASTDSAVAAECVAEQDEEQFWNYHDAIFENQDTSSDEWGRKDFLMDLARENTEGLDYDQLDSCISSQDTRSVVESHRQMGNSNDVTATPTIFVNGQQVRSDYENVKAAIEQELR